MTNEQRKIRRKLRILEHALATWDANQICRDLSICRGSLSSVAAVLPVGG
jgi:hypothetical protein